MEGDRRLRLQIPAGVSGDQATGMGSCPPCVVLSYPSWSAADAERKIGVS